MKPSLKPMTVCLVLVACLAGLQPTATLAATSVTDLAEQQMAVRELMRLETSAALQRARNQHASGQQPGGGMPAPATNAQTGNLALLAIYGVGRKLLARVLQGSKTYVYVRGQVLPVGVRPANSKSVFRLQGMSSRCVELRRQDDSRTLCLHPALLSGG